MGLLTELLDCTGWGHTDLMQGEDANGAPSFVRTTRGVQCTAPTGDTMSGVLVLRRYRMRDGVWIRWRLRRSRKEG
eukprot:5655284-Ditylum_brightwellii.AAC.1